MTAREMHREATSNGKDSKCNESRNRISPYVELQPTLASSFVKAGGRSFYKPPPRAYLGPTFCPWSEG